MTKTAKRKGNGHKKWRCSEKGIHFLKLMSGLETSPLWFKSCCTVLSVQAFSPHTVSPFVSVPSRRLALSELSVFVLLSPPHLRTWGSARCFHTHLSVFAPSRTDTFPFILPQSSPSFFWFPLSLTFSLPLSLQEMLVYLNWILHTVTCLRQWHPLITILILFCIWRARLASQPSWGQSFSLQGLVL